MHVMLGRIDGEWRILADVDGHMRWVNPRDIAGFRRDILTPDATIFICTLKLDYEHETDISPEDSYDDPEDIKAVRERMANDEPFAWFCAVIKAERGDYEGIDSLGGCSYESREDFETMDGYFPDMVRSAMAQCQAQFIAAFGTFDTAEDI